jgi:hypothetical protein
MKPVDAVSTANHFTNSIHFPLCGCRAIGLAGEGGNMSMAATWRHVSVMSALPQ